MTGNIAPIRADRPPAAFVDSGYVVQKGDVSTYYGPDPMVLLDSSFAATHCLSIRSDARGRPGQIGVAFAPPRDRTVSDIAGVLWLTREPLALKTLEFEYRGVDQSVIDMRGGGRLVQRERRRDDVGEEADRQAEGGRGPLGERELGHQLLGDPVAGLVAGPQVVAERLDHVVGRDADVGRAEPRRQPRAVAQWNPDVLDVTNLVRILGSDSGLHACFSSGWTPLLPRSLRRIDGTAESRETMRRWRKTVSC